MGDPFQLRSWSEGRHKLKSSLEKSPDKCQKTHIIQNLFHGALVENSTNFFWNPSLRWKSSTIFCLCGSHRPQPEKWWYFRPIRGLENVTRQIGQTYSQTFWHYNDLCPPDSGRKNRDTTPRFEKLSCRNWDFFSNPPPNRESFQNFFGFYFWCLP